MQLVWQSESPQTTVVDNDPYYLIIIHSSQLLSIDSIGIH
jgi:hypothetical protein